jgi:pimeloyl-ACP methyl ester carboxylesterase
MSMANLIAALVSGASGVVQVSIEKHQSPDCLSSCGIAESSRRTAVGQLVERPDHPLLVQGRLDQVTPGEATQRLYASLTAPSKQLVWFEKSAHMPHFDEPEKFRRVLLEMKAAHLTHT